MHNALLVHVVQTLSRLAREPASVSAIIINSNDNSNNNTTDSSNFDEKRMIMSDGTTQKRIPPQDSCHPIPIVQARVRRAAPSYTTTNTIDWAVVGGYTAMLRARPFSQLVGSGQIDGYG